MADIFEAIPDDVVGICRRLREAGKQGWVVGGCVRDILRGASAKDWDVATDAHPNEVRKMFRRVVPTGIDHGTVTVLIDHRPYEVTTLRGEGDYVDGRRPESVVFHDDVVEDLARRDFTFNAIALDPIDCEIVDPFDGRGDLERGVLRAVGDPQARFREDGLRILRATRFAAVLECDIDPATRAAMGASEPLATLSKVSVERVHDEWLKTMRAARPSIGFSLMQEVGVLALFCPELGALVGVTRPEGDAWEHSLGVMDRLDDPVLRLAGLLHGLGLGETLGPDYPTRSAEMTESILRRLRFSNEHRERIVHLVRHHRLGDFLSWTGPELRRWLRAVTPARVNEVLRLAEADLRQMGDPHADRVDDLRARVREALEQEVPLGTKDLALKGGDLIRGLGLSPGPMVGAVMEELVEAVLDDPDINTPERLLDAARRNVERRGSS